MRLSDFKGEEALDVLADLVEPASAIMSDKEVASLVKSDEPVVRVVRAAIKNHKADVIKILAILDGEDPKTYADKVTLLTLPAKLLNLVNDPDVKILFQSQGQKNETFSGSAMENTGENEQ